eukprot:GHVN01058109.1.p1 GENE.GHVN01058109.1~~GHVN01058109.1.p1  ORF type:complete len:310 (-),score=18.95 GHVN01058109.1:87-1016(-)
MLKNFLTAVSFLLSSRIVTANPSSAKRGARDKFEAPRKLQMSCYDPPSPPCPPLDSGISYELTPGQAIEFDGEITNAGEWNTGCNGIPLCFDFECELLPDPARVAAFAYVNYECLDEGNRLCYLIVPKENILLALFSNDEIKTAGNGQTQEQCFIRNGCLDVNIFSEVTDGNGFFLVSSGPLRLDLTTACVQSDCSTDSDCDTLPPTGDMGNDCYIGNVCDGNVCVPSYSAPGRVCGVAEKKKKKRCQSGNMDSRTTCEVETSDDGTLCSNPRLRGKYYYSGNSTSYHFLIKSKSTHCVSLKIDSLCVT